MEGQPSIVIAVIGDEEARKDDLLFSFVSHANPNVLRSDECHYSLNYHMDGRAFALTLCSPHPEAYSSRSPSPQPDDRHHHAHSLSPRDHTPGAQGHHHHHRIHIHLPRLRRSRDKVPHPLEPQPERPGQQQEADVIGTDGTPSPPPAVLPADVFLVLYSAVDPPTAGRVAAVCKTLAKSGSRAPVVLAAVRVEQREGAKADRCFETYEREALDRAEGVELARDCRCVAYVEASAATNEGVTTCFETCIRAVVTPERLPKLPTAEEVNRAIVLWLSPDGAPLGIPLPGVCGRSVPLDGVPDMAAWLHRFGHASRDRLIVLCEGLEDARSARDVLLQWLHGEHKRSQLWHKGAPPIPVVALAGSPEEWREMMAALCTVSASDEVPVVVCDKPQSVAQHLFIKLKVKASKEKDKESKD